LPLSAQLAIGTRLLRTRPSPAGHKHDPKTAVRLLRQKHKDAPTTKEKQ